MRTKHGFEALCHRTTFAFLPNQAHRKASFHRPHRNMSTNVSMLGSQGVRISASHCTSLPRPHLLRRQHLAGQRYTGRQEGQRHHHQQHTSLVTCMAHPRRQAKVAKQIEREVGNLLLTDQVLQKAVCPEKRVGIDTAISALASVTEVEVSSDLAIAKVYLSIFSDDHGKSIAMASLKRLEGYVRKHIATSMNLRLAPEVRFLQDDTIERAEQVYALLDQIRAEKGEPSVAASLAGDGSTNGHDGVEAVDVTESNEHQPSLEAALETFPPAPTTPDTFFDAVMASQEGNKLRSDTRARQRTPSLRFQKRS